jgi:hypothetical protein
MVGCKYIKRSISQFIQYYQKSTTVADIIWQYNSIGKDSVQSLYVIINDGGWDRYKPLWCGKYMSPLRIHIFLWLLINNKILTGDNLAKRRKVDDGTCLFCNETETIVHLFFKCCVACCWWKIVAEIMNMPVIRDFESMAKWWIKGGI